MRLKKHLIFQNVYKTRPLATDRNDLFKFLVTSQHAIIKKGICSAMKSPPSGKLCPLHSCLKSKNNRRRSSVCLSVCLAVVKKNPTRRAIGVNESVHRPSGVCFRLCCCCCCCLSVSWWLWLCWLVDFWATWDENQNRAKASRRPAQNNSIGNQSSLRAPRRLLGFTTYGLFHQGSTREVVEVIIIVVIVITNAFASVWGAARRSRISQPCPTSVAGAAFFISCPTVGAAVVIILRQVGEVCWQDRRTTLERSTWIGSFLVRSVVNNSKQQQQRARSWITPQRQADGCASCECLRTAFGDF